MWYAILCKDIANSLRLRQEVRPAHLARLDVLRNEGRLLTAGPHPSIDAEDPGDNGFSGSLIIAEFDSLSAAEEWANNDPYTLQGIFSEVLVKPYRKVY